MNVWMSAMLKSEHDASLLENRADSDMAAIGSGAYLEARSASINVGILTQAKRKFGDYIDRQIVGTNISLDVRDKCLGARIAPMDVGISARAWGQLGDYIIHLIAGTRMSFDFRSQCPEARSASFNVGILTQAKRKFGDYIYRQIVGTNMSFDVRDQCLGARIAPRINGQAGSSLTDGGERGGLKGFVSVNTREG